ncbi:galactinol synthase 2 [Lathyrus oleraceus]|uniref:galactinol synthase 2 n=1 Tax=Pisum sativum TaxID=3888 RepID=UPI0021D37F00|nr:galactinol synthase 2-like [Pisum sativum]
MIYLDGDIQVFENIDHLLFDLPNNYLYAVIDFHFYSSTTFDTDSKASRNRKEQQKLNKPTSFAEQEFLNMYFNDKYKRIPNVYNLVLAMLWSHLEKVKVVHYCAAGSKPYYM